MSKKMMAALFATVCLIPASLLYENRPKIAEPVVIPHGVQVLYEDTDFSELAVSYLTN